MSATKTEVCEYIESNRDELVAFLSELVAARSLPGEEQPAQRVMREKFDELDLEIDAWEPDIESLREHPAFFETNTYTEYGYEGRENIAATDFSDGDGPSLTFSGHVDVVSPEPISDWSYDPWTGTVEDGRIYGRGTYDMKGGVAAMTMAYQALADLGVELDGDLTLQTTIEEEAGGVGGVLSALERGHQPDAAIITEPSGVPTLGVASAGVRYFRVTVPGKAAHTAFQFRGVDAVGEAFKIYQRLMDLYDERNERIEDYGPAINQYPEAEGRTTNLSLTNIEVPGSWTSTVPGEAIMEYRIGWPPSAEQTHEDIEEEVAAAIAEVVDEDEWLSENPPELEWFGWKTNPHEVDFESEFFELVCEKTEETTGGEVDYRGGLAGNDERFYNRYYDIPCPSVGPRGENAHGADEFAEIDSLVETAQILALTAMDWCGVREE
ncbi:peptidase M20 family protein [Natrialba magadii ATCC 43099]|nr:ArgE/DapE family deacylase [Natrialba magadii]ADD03696.1 peptidase M20 family protein [Natrialba magadii ATCC 43099]